MFLFCLLLKLFMLRNFVVPPKLHFVFSFVLFCFWGLVLFVCLFVCFLFCFVCFFVLIFCFVLILFFFFFLRRTCVTHDDVCYGLLVYVCACVV